MTTISETAAPGRPSRWARLLPLQLVYVLFLPVWFALSIAATMGLANTEEWWALPVLLVVWLYPVVLLASAITSHVLFPRATRPAVLLNLLPAPWVLAGVALLVWIFSADFSFGP